MMHLALFGPIFIVAAFVMVMAKFVMVVIIVMACGDGGVMMVVV